MLQVRKGDAFPVNGNARNGVSGNGSPYAYLHLKEEQGRKEITIWATNPESVVPNNGDLLVIDEINDVKYSARKGNDDQWRDSLSIQARMHVEFQELSTPNAFREITGDDDGDLPF